MSSHDSQLPVNTLPAEVRDGITELLQQKAGTSVSSSDFKIIAGGCINHGGRLQTSVGDYFVKWNDVRHNPAMFELEEKGLATLSAPKVINVAGAVGTGKTDAYQFIIIDFIDSAQASKNFWIDFGHSLAGLHRVTAKTFGLGYNNYIGSLQQSNKESASWIDFFREERISKQLMMAEKAGITDHVLRKKFDLLFNKLDQLILEGKPSLLHGDLWSGNVVTDSTGAPCLIDPAVYFGNAEVELSYTKLFGGFDPSFYSAYETILAPEPGFDQRADLYNLYPLLVHTNLFGKKYVQMIEDILKKFI